MSTYDIGRFRYLVAAWSARHARPHGIIEDDELREIFVMLYSAVDLHSRQTVVRDISDMYQRSRTAIATHLQSVKQRLHIALDGWTSPNVFSFLGVTVRYCENGKIHGFVLDFVKYGYILHFTLKFLIETLQDVGAPHRPAPRLCAGRLIESFRHREKGMVFFYLHRNPLTPHTGQDSHDCM